MSDLKRLVGLHESAEIADTTLEFDVVNDYDENGDYVAKLHPKYSGISSFAALEKVSELNSSIEALRVNFSEKFLVGYVPADQNRCVQLYAQRMGDKDFDGYSCADTSFYHRVKMQRIAKPPTENIFEGITYRTLWSNNGVIACVPHTNPAYKYLDVGMVVILYLPKDGKRTKLIYSKEVTIETFMVAHLLSRLNGHNAKVLQDECFIPAKNARMMVLGLEKQLAALSPDQFDPQQRDGYIYHKNAMNKAFLGSVEQRVLNEFLEEKTESVDRWDIRFTKTTAKYEALTVGYAGLLDIISAHGYVSWSKQFDIYDLVAAVANKLRYSLKNDAQDTFTANGMQITVSKHNYRVSINGFPINQDEVVDVVRRTLCYTDVVEYNKFVANVSKMSLLNHDALASGLTLPWRKLPAGTGEAGSSFYRRDRDNNWKNMPRLRFKRIDGVIGVVTDVDGEKHTPMRNFTGFVRSIQRLFKTINFGGTRDYEGNYVIRDYKYAEKKLVALLRKHISSPPRRVKNADKTWTKVDPAPLITEKEATAILVAADTVTEKAIARAKEFLASIVTRVGAEKAELNGSAGYKVKGKKHIYFVNEDTNQVHSYETGNSICIVNANHQVNLGHDELATRLLLLKNDEKTVGQVGTLSAYVNS